MFLKNRTRILQQGCQFLNIPCQFSIHMNFLSPFHSLFDSYKKNSIKKLHIRSGMSPSYGKFITRLDPLLLIVWKSQYIRKRGCPRNTILHGKSKVFLVHRTIKPSSPISTIRGYSDISHCARGQKIVALRGALDG